MQNIDENPLVRFMARRRTTFTWLVPIAMAIAAWFWGHPSWLVFGLGVVLLILGEMMRFWAAGTIYKDNVVATSGPYAFVRNPLYFGSLLMAFGYASMSGLGPVGLVACVGLFTIFHLAAIVSEESFLKAKFGAPYLEYLTHVPRLIPRPIPYRAPQNEPQCFSWKQVLYNREPVTAAITALSAVAFGVLQLIKLHHY